MAYTVCATWVAKDGEEEAVARALARIHALAAGEPDILAYQFHRDPDDPRRFFFYEQYRDAEAYERHLQTPYVVEHGFGDAMPRLTSRTRTFWTTWDPDPVQT
jgi:quinol monooxygenase YgiN